MVNWRAVIVLLVASTTILEAFPSSGHVIVRRDEDVQEKLLQQFKSEQGKDGGGKDTKGSSLNELLQKLKKGRSGGSGGGGGEGDGDEGKVNKLLGGGGMEKVKKFMGGGGDENERRFMGGGGRHYGGGGGGWNGDTTGGQKGHVRQVKVNPKKRVLLGDLLRQLGQEGKGGDYENRDITDIMKKLAMKSKSRNGDGRTVISLADIMAELKKEDGSGSGGEEDDEGATKGSKVMNMNEVMQKYGGMGSGGGGDSGGCSHGGNGGGCKAHVKEINLHQGKKVVLGDLLRQMGLEGHAKGYENRDITEILKRLTSQTKPICDSQGVCRSPISLSAILAELKKEGGGGRGGGGASTRHGSGRGGGSGGVKPLFSMSQEYEGGNSKSGKPSIVLNFNLEEAKKQFKSTMEKFTREKVMPAMQFLSAQASAKGKQGNPLAGLMSMVQNFFGGGGSAQKKDDDDDVESTTNKVGGDGKLKKKKNKSEEEE